MKGTHMWDRMNKEEWELVGLMDNEGPFKNRYWELMRPRLVQAVAKIEAEVENILEWEEHLENEYLSTGGECGVAHAEAVGSAIQAGFDSYDAKLYVRQQRPEERS